MAIKESKENKLWIEGRIKADKETEKIHKKEINKIFKDFYKSINMKPNEQRAFTPEEAERLEKILEKERPRIDNLMKIKNRKIFAEYKKKIRELEIEIKRFKDEGKTVEQISKAIKIPKNKVVEILNKKKTEIDIETIELIHGIERQQDGYISFCRKINKEHQDLSGIKISELRNYIPELLPYLLQDSYFSINASYRSAHWKSKITGLQGSTRKEINLKYLNACFSDLDCYKSGLDWSEAVSIILKAQDENLIPPASIIARSGRGIYLLWLLTSERLGAQQSAFPREIELYKQINRVLGRTLNAYNSKLNWDNVAISGSQILRIPGSTHTQAKQQVNFLIQVKSGGVVPVYTLKTLAENLLIPIKPIPDNPDNFYLRQIKNRGSYPERRQGKIAIGNYRLKDLLTISEYCGGFKQGKRWKSISYYCYFAKSAGHTLSDIQNKAYELANKCIPKYPSEPNDTPVNEIVNGIWLGKTRKFNNNFLADFFDIDSSLADKLNLHSIIPIETLEKRKSEPSRQETERKKRRELIRQIIDKNPEVKPTLVELRIMLKNHGLKAGIQTIWRDLQAVIKGF